MAEGTRTELGVIFVDESATCDWHQSAGVEFTIDPRVCNGPACRAYRDAHADDGTEGAIEI